MEAAPRLSWSPFESNGVGGEQKRERFITQSLATYMFIKFPVCEKIIKNCQNKVTKVGEYFICLCLTK